MKSLESRRIAADLLFIFKSINSAINCPQLLEWINFDAPTRSYRPVRALLPYRCTSRFVDSDPVNRVCMCVGTYGCEFILPLLHISFVR